MNRWCAVRNIVLTASFILLNGCYQESQEDVDSFLQRVKKEQNGKIETIPKIQAHQAYSYSSSQLKSPFEPSAGFSAARGANDEEKARPDADRIKDSLEEFPLDSLKMVGVLKRGMQVWGLIVDKKGIIHRVKLGNYVGQNSGRITEITEDTIYVAETIADGHGGWLEREATLTIAE